MKETVTTTCKEVFGHKKHCHKEWITQGTLEKVADRKRKKTAVNNSCTRTERAHAQEAYTAANRCVKNIIKIDQKNYVEALNR